MTGIDASASSGNAIIAGPGIPNSDVPVRPGRDPVGQALPDADVWDQPIGKTGRPLDTSDGIDGWERNRLIKLADKSPTEFLSRLKADSENGSPVHYEHTQRAGNFGVATISLDCEDALLNIAGQFDIYNKAVDGFIGDAIADGGREKNTRTRLTLGIGGEINDQDGIDDIRAEAKVTNIPTFSGDKVLEMKELFSDMKAALGLMAKSRRNPAVMDVFQEGLERVADLPIPFLIKAISRMNKFSGDFTMGDFPAKVHLEINEGHFAVRISDVLGDEDQDDEAQIAAEFSGSVEREGNTFTFDEIRVYTAEPVHVEFQEVPSEYPDEPASTRPVLMRDTADGRKPVNDHLFDAQRVVAMAGGALARNSDPF